MRPSDGGDPGSGQGSCRRARERPSQPTGTGPGVVSTVRTYVRSTHMRTVGPALGTHEYEKPFCEPLLRSCFDDAAQLYGVRTSMFPRRPRRSRPGQSLDVGAKEEGKEKAGKGSGSIRSLVGRKLPVPRTGPPPPPPPPPPPFFLPPSGRSYFLAYNTSVRTAYVRVLLPYGVTVSPSPVLERANARLVSSWLTKHVCIGSCRDVVVLVSCTQPVPHTLPH